VTTKYREIDFMEQIHIYIMLQLVQHHTTTSNLFSHMSNI